jgi:hypothetical protein
MRTITAEYEDIQITLARPTLADGRMRAKVWAALRKEEGSATNSATMFGWVITQIVSTVNYDFEKMVVYPGDERVVEMYEIWMNETDEKLNELLSEKIVDLNGLRRPDSAEKKLSEPSPNGTSEVEKIPTL